MDSLEVGSLEVSRLDILVFIDFHSLAHCAIVDVLINSLTSQPISLSRPRVVKTTPTGVIKKSSFVLLC